MKFTTALDRCTPGLWSLRVRSTSLEDRDADPVRTTIPCPEDKNVAAELGRRGLPPGKYVVTMQAQQRGESGTVERNKVRLKTRERIEQGTIVVSRAMAEAPPEAREPAGGVDQARREAERSKLEAIRAEAEERRASAEARRRKLERAEPPENLASIIREAVAALRPPPDNSLATLLPVLLEQQQKAAAAHAQLLQAMLSRADEERNTLLEALTRPQVVAAGDGGLAGAAKQIESVSVLLDLVERLGDRRGGGGSDDNGIVGLVRDLLAMRQQGPAPATAPAGAPRLANGPAPAQVGPADAAKLEAQQRCRSFVATLVREFSIGADPTAVAEQLDLGLLPGPVRSSLEAGNWRGAWSACCGLDPELAEALGTTIDGDEARAWLEQLAQFFADGDDDEHTAAGIVGMRLS